MKKLSFVTFVMCAVLLTTGVIFPDTKALARAPEPVAAISVISANITYPDIARNYHVEGEVDVLLTINQDGNVIDAKVTKGIGFGCDEAALEAAKQIQFTRITDGDLKATTQMTLPFIFKMKK
jgi:periplasmic protein TonB